MSNETIKFVYKFPDNYNPVYINGAYGGVTPKGEIVANFYLERHPLPYTEAVTIDESGRIAGPVQITEPQGHDANVLRYVSTGVVMNLESAKLLQEWLDQQIRLLEGRQL